VPIGRRKRKAAAAGHLEPVAAVPVAAFLDELEGRRHQRPRHLQVHVKKRHAELAKGRVDALARGDLRDKRRGALVP
jgi:hypothetical protein